MLINTKFLGEIEVDEKALISFDHGLPGFTELHKFALLAVEENPALHYMQSIEEAGICFVVINPFLLMEDYEIELSEETVAKLEIKKPEDVILYSILTIPENIKDITANLMAPIVINTANNKAVQEIQNDDRYSIKHRLYRGE